MLKALTAFDACKAVKALQRVKRVKPAPRILPAYRLVTLNDRSWDCIHDYMVLHGLNAL